MRRAILGLLLLGFAGFSLQIILDRTRSTRALAQNSSPPSCGTGCPVGPREVDFPYYSLRDGFDSTLNLVSDSPSPIDLTIAIHGLAGQTVFTETTIQPGANLALDLSQLLTGLGADTSGAFAEGGISVYYTGTIMPVVGQVTITNPATGLIHESEMVENDPGRSDIPASLNGAWWNLSSGRDAQIMISNTSGNVASADVFLDFAGQRHPSASLIFAPNETKVLSVTALLSALHTSPSAAPEGGITIVSRGSPPTLIAQGKVFDPVTGFSTTLEFPDPARQQASALHASGIPIGTPTKDSPFRGMGNFLPHVVVRNLWSVPQTVTITPEYPTGQFGPQGNSEFDGAGGEATGTLSLGPFSVDAYSTLDIPLLGAMSQLPLPLPYASVRVQYSGPPGSLVAQVSSVDANQNLVVDSRLMNEGDGWAGSGANPWHLDNETESILFLTNMSEQPARIGFVVTANGVHYYLTRLNLSPHETRAIDLRQLRDAQGVDFMGNKIPVQASDGSVNWIRLDNVPVMGRLVVISRQGGVASSYDCNTCYCPASYTSLTTSPSAFDLIPGATMDCTCQADYTDCNNNVTYSNVTSAAAWSSSNTAVASVASGGAVKGVSAGSATITAVYSGYTRSYNSYQNTCISNLVQRTGSSSCNVVCPVPVNFTQSGSSANGSGLLVFSYSWGSSTGTLSDLSKCSCTVGESVSYPGGNPYYWPRPPWSASSANPTTNYAFQSATQTPLIDTHHPGVMVAPYGAASFTATQYYGYVCSGVNNGNPVTLSGPISIVRSVTQNRDGTFKYTITKSGASATCTVGVNCTQ